MNRIFKKVFLLNKGTRSQREQSERKLDNTTDFLFYTTYLNFTFLIRNDGYFSLTDFLSSYTSEARDMEIYNHIKKIFRFNIDNDIIKIWDGEHYDGTYIHWYYITIVIYIFFPKLSQRLVDLINVNYKHLDISNQIKNIQKNIEYINNGLDYVLLLKLSNRRKSMLNSPDGSDTPLDDITLKYEDFLEKEKNNLKLLYNNLLKYKDSITQQQYYIINNTV
jgi:hypothetical protein